MRFFPGGIGMRLADLIGGVVVLILGLAVVFFSSQLPYYSEYGPGPGFLPLWLGVVLIGCAIFVIPNQVLKQVQDLRISGSRFWV